MTKIIEFEDAYPSYEVGKDNPPTKTEELIGGRMASLAYGDRNGKIYQRFLVISPLIDISSFFEKENKTYTLRLGNAKLRGARKGIFVYAVCLETHERVVIDFSAEILAHMLSTVPFLEEFQNIAKEFLSNLKKSNVGKRD